MGFCKTYGQEILLKVEAATEKHTEILNSVGSLTTFKDLESLKKEIFRIQRQIYNKGYIDVKFLSLVDNGLSYTAKFDLGPMYKSILIFGHSQIFESLGFISKKDLNSKEKYVEVPIPRLEKTLELISKSLSLSGYSFATVRLKNINSKNNYQITADVVIEKGHKRSLHEVKILGYNKFPKGFIRHFLKIKTQETFDIESIRSKMTLLDELNFVEQKRSAEVLFLEDTTSVYLYLKKLKSNRFDGFLGFGSNETTNKIDFDGYLNLNLINNLNFGESLNLNYKSDEIDQKTINISVLIPYLLSTPLGSTINLNIFKKDSTFTTARQSIDLHYNLNENNRLGIGIQSEQSNVINNTINTLVEDYKSEFYEIHYKYKKRQKLDKLNPIKTKLDISLAFGSRKSNNTIKQRKISLKGSKIFNLNSKSSVYLKLHIEELKSEKYIINELLRFGGIASIRGFQENSLFAARMGIICTEYRYRLSPELFVNSVIDSGSFQNINKEYNQIYGFGFGFGLLTKSGILKMTYANGKTRNSTFDFSNSKLHLSFTNIF
tara:strand:+ start:23091 stop:24734 length:1644 start_codon:yes stop_codon:yes gene_type:complete